MHSVQNPDSAKPAFPFMKPSHALLITWSHPNLRPSLYATLHSESPCEPLHIGGKDGEEEGLQFIWSLHECSSSLLGWYWKDAPGFPPAKRQAEKPLGNILFRRRQILYSAHTQTHTYKLQFLAKRHLCPIFRSCSFCAYFHIQQDIILKDCNFENESWRLL